MLKIEKPVVDAKDLALWFEGELNKIIQHGEVMAEYEPQINSIKIGVQIDNCRLYYTRLCGSEIDPILKPDKYLNCNMCTGDELARRHITAIVYGFKQHLSTYFVKDFNHNRYEQTGDV